MDRVEIVAFGDVQRVGFRDLVEKLGRDLGLSGTVENQEPYEVRIVAEGEEEALKEFLKALRIKRGPIQVQDLEVTWTSATGEFPYFKILRGDWQEELGERFDVAVGLLHRSVELGEENLALGRENLAIGRENLAIGRESLAIGRESLAVSKENLAVSKENLALGRENLAVSKENLAIGRIMLEKQDATISILKNIKEDTSQIGAIKEEVSTARYEARSEREEIISALRSGSLEDKYEELRREIAEIKAYIADLRARGA